MGQTDDHQVDAMPGKPKRASRRVYQRKTDIVLQAAEKCFLKVGYANTSMDTIAAQAGVSKRTIYSNFSDKKALFAAVIRKLCSAVLHGAEEAIDDEAPVETVLVELATSFLTAIYSPLHVQLYQTVVAASRRFPDVGKVMFDGQIMESQRLFDRYLRRQQQLGRLQLPDIDLAAQQLIALLKTNVHMRLLFCQPADISKTSITESAATSIRLFLHGAGASPSKAA